MTMLITVSSSTQPVSNQHPLSPPPTLPKPGKDNLRLQRLLKRAARKNAMLAAEQGKAFRSSLSPVSEASPDQERAESPEPRAERPDPTAESPEPRAERPGPRAERPGPTAERPGPTAERPGPTAERPGPTAERPGPTAERPGPTAERPGPTAERPGPTAERPGPTAESPAALPAQLPVRPAPQRAPSPLRKGKPFALKVTEQRRIAEHVRLTACSAMPLLQKPGAPDTPRQPEGSHLPSPSNPSVPAFPQPPPSSAPSKERAEVTYVTKVNTYFHSVKPPRAKTPTPNPTQGTVGHEDTRPTSPAPQTSSSEPSPGQTPISPKDSKVTPPSPKPPLLPAAETEPPDQAPKPAPTEKPSTSDTHTNKPTTHGSDTEISGSKIPPELPKQDRDIINPSTSSAPWRQARPATPAQADGTRSTSTDTKAEHIPEHPQVTPSSPNSSCPPKAEPAPPSVKAPRPPGASASAWHRLKKHLMVPPEAINFPESKPEKLGQEEGNKEDAAQAVIKQDCMLVKSKATRMWDAILYQVALSKERKQRAEEKKPQKEESVFLPRRLPILLHKPRFDARKLKELAAKPMTKISTVFEVSRFRARGAEEHSKSFNRTASGWSVN